MSRILRPSVRNLVGKKNLVGVEVGVFMGRNSKDMLDLLDIRKLYLVDPYSGESTIFGCSGYKAHVIKDYAHKQLEDYNDKIVWIEDTSDCIVYYIDEELDFAYLDGDHKYDGVTKDLNNFYRVLKSGGLIGGHDFDEEAKGNQVKRAVYDFFTPLNKVIYYDKDPYDEKTNDWWTFK